MLTPRLIQNYALAALKTISVSRNVISQTLPMNSFVRQATAAFHMSNILNRRSNTKNPKRDYREKLDCPETKEEECQNKKAACAEKENRELERKCCRHASIAENKCEPSSNKRRPRIRKKKAFKSMWEKPKGERPDFVWDYPKECCPECEYIRFDELYYHPSNKCRKYQRTWWECCPRLVPKQVCCWCDAIPPEVDRRCVDTKELAGECVAEHEQKRMACLRKKQPECTRIRVPGCRAARVPPQCSMVPIPKGCRKVKCPFPSFSECVQEELADLPQRPPECRCFGSVARCLISQYAERMREHKLKLYPCE